VKVRGSAATVYPEPQSSRAGMSLKENLQTAKNFVDNGWRNAERTRIVEEIISTSNETHRQADTWNYNVDEDGLFIISGGRKVYIKDVVKRSGSPERQEFETLEKLESWAKDSESGTVAWISPPYPGKYPCSKLMLHQISYEFGTLQKTIRSVAILFDSSETATLNALKRLFPDTKEFSNLEDLRSFLIKVPHEISTELIANEIKKLDKNVLRKQHLSQKDLVERASYISELIVGGANSRFVSYEMQRLGLLGQFSISCPSSSSNSTNLLSVSETLVSSLELKSDWHIGTCRICNLVTWVGGCSICHGCVMAYF
jgi:hypothetical protein